MTGWQLPERVCIGGSFYPIHTDFRDILEILSWLDDPAYPEFIRWQVALALFYEGEIPDSHRREAMEYLSLFLSGGQETKPGPRLMDWQQDCAAIVSDINRVAGREIRSMEKLHWWTFLSWFHGVGEGQLSTLVAIRDKLRRGKKLDGWEQEFYREHKDRVVLKKRYTPQELEEQQRLQQLLG